MVFIYNLPNYNLLIHLGYEDYHFSYSVCGHYKGWKHISVSGFTYFSNCFQFMYFAQKQFQENKILKIKKNNDKHFIWNLNFRTNNLFCALKITLIISFFTFSTINSLFSYSIFYKSVIYIHHSLGTFYMPWQLSSFSLFDPQNNKCSCDLENIISIL